MNEQMYKEWVNDWKLYKTFTMKTFLLLYKFWNLKLQVTCNHKESFGEKISYF